MTIAFYSAKYVMGGIAGNDRVRMTVVGYDETGRPVKELHLPGIAVGNYHYDFLTKQYTPWTGVSSWYISVPARIGGDRLQIGGCSSIGYHSYSDGGDRYAYDITFDCDYNLENLKIYTRRYKAPVDGGGEQSPAPDIPGTEPYEDANRSLHTLSAYIIQTLDDRWFAVRNVDNKKLYELVGGAMIEVRTYTENIHRLLGGGYSRYELVGVIDGDWLYVGSRFGRSWSAAINMAADQAVANPVGGPEPIPDSRILRRCCFQNDGDWWLYGESPNYEWAPRVGSFPYAANKTPYFTCDTPAVLNNQKPEALRIKRRTHDEYCYAMPKRIYSESTLTAKQTRFWKNLTLATEKMP